MSTKKPLFRHGHSMTRSHIWPGWSLGHVLMELYQGGPAHVTHTRLDLSMSMSKEKVTVVIDPFGRSPRVFKDRRSGADSLVERCLPGDRKKLGRYVEGTSDMEVAAGHSIEEVEVE